jgi:hypothetical protein
MGHVAKQTLQKYFTVITSVPEGSLKTESNLMRIPKGQSFVTAFAGMNGQSCDVLCNETASGAHIISVEPITFTRRMEANVLPRSTRGPCTSQ